MSRARFLLPLFLGLVLGGGAVWVATRRPAPPVAPAPPAPAPAPTKYQCPMHPQIVRDHPGDCPICGMKLVPIQAPAAAPASRKLLFYRNPMDPAVHSSVPIKDEMGMDYVPVYEDEVQASPVEGQGTVTLSPERRQLVGLKTAAVTRGPVGGAWRTSARVAVDETRVRKVTVKVEGFVERLFADFTGKPVVKGQPLLSLYSPELVSAQNELLLALKTQKALGEGLQGSGRELVEAARQRLRLWDVPSAAIEALERTGQVQRSLTILAPVSGVVTAKAVVEGARVTPGEPLLEVTDLGQVWVLGDVYEAELPQVRVGLPGTFTVSGKAYRGAVSFVDPVLDPRTRTAKVRMNVANPRGELKPELFGEAAFQGKVHDGLQVPTDAVVDSGTRKIVFVDLGDGRLQPREVELGAASGDRVEVRKGLEEGELVVVRANFLVDSESRLKAALAAMGG